MHMQEKIGGSHFGVDVIIIVISLGSIMNTDIAQFHNNVLPRLLDVFPPFHSRMDRFTAFMKSFIERTLFKQILE